MSTTFPEFRNYLKIFFLVTFLTISALNLNAQTSFDLRIDGLVSGNPTETRAQKMKPCADGGFFMTGLNGSYDYFVIKTESVGNVEWSKVLLQGNHLHPAEIIATNDSGFYFMNNQLDGWVGLFHSVTISKVDKYGNILKSKYIPHLQVPPDGNENVFCDVDPINNDLLIMGRYYDYDGSSGTCCHEYYLYKMDSSLNVIFCTRLDNGVEGALDRINMKSKSVYLNNQIAGYIAMGLLNYSPNYGSYVYYLDSTGNLIWTRKYLGLQFKDFVQVGNSLFFISSRSLGGNAYSSKIIKTDFSGNIILSKELQLSGSLLLDGISANDGGELLISGSHFSLPPIIRSNLIMLSDTALNVMVAKKGEIFNSNFWTNSVPVGNLNSFLLAKIEQFGNIINAIFEKIDFSNPLCNYNNLPITNIPVAVIDSVVNYANLPYPITFVDDTISFVPEFFNYSNPCLTLEVEDWNGIPDIQFLKVNPNPASDYIELSIDEVESTYQVTIYNITGEAVVKFEMDGNNRKIPIANLSQGIYFVNVITENQQFNAKFIKL